MNHHGKLLLGFVVLVLSGFGAFTAGAQVYIQCPCLALDANVNPDPTTGTINPATGNIECTLPGPRQIACKALTAGDGHVMMADGNDIYVFGFSDVTGVATDQVMNTGFRAANTSAPTINVKEGQELYLSLTNVSMVERPDLFDPHTVHYHGFPNAGSIFDGEPMASVAINMGNTLTYYYKQVEPGTYMYHCHVEAAEHMQMGMLGNLFVRPAQDDNVALKNLGIPAYTGFAYNDTDATTGYHVAYPIQETAFDPNFHHNDNSYNPLDFAGMDDTYLLFNGRGYPDTINPSPILNIYGHASQPVNSKITATRGQKILLRISSLATTEFYTVATMGIPMRVVGNGARIFRGGGVATGRNLYYNTNSITLGGGQAMDVILDTSAVAAGTYFLYTTNLHHLNNNQEDFGGMMTEIVINP
jgi:FtsP/CotA-like multicopper oxidase with cupredoxin domain